MKAHEFGGGWHKLLILLETKAVNDASAEATTGDEKGLEREYSSFAAAEQGPLPFWRCMPDCELDPDARRVVRGTTECCLCREAKSTRRKVNDFSRRPFARGKGGKMRVVYARCAGMDVHKKSISVCVRTAKGKKVEIVTAVFGTFTQDLERLREFLRQYKVRRVVMESTGVFWMPVWNVLERGDWRFDLVLVNPQHVRALKGEKTDDKDCRRLAELGQYDLVCGSFIPNEEIRELRDLTRQRSHVQGDRNRVINRIGRLLETRNFKLGSVASNIVGKTGWLILNAICQGQTDPDALADFAQGSLQLKKAELAEALRGYSSEHFRWLLRQLTDELSRLDTKLNELDTRIRDRMRPYEDLVRRLSTIPGVKEIAAWTLIAELGTDMTQFPDAAHAASWAGLCPGNCESAGKR